MVISLTFTNLRHSRNLSEVTSVKKVLNTILLQGNLFCYLMVLPPKPFLKKRSGISGRLMVSSLSN